MTDILAFGDSRSAALRHDVLLSMPDPVAYVETGGRRCVVVGSLDVPRFRDLGFLEVLSFEELGLDGVLAEGRHHAHVLHRRAARRARGLPPRRPRGGAPCLRRRAPRGHRRGAEPDRLRGDRGRGLPDAAREGGGRGARGRFAHYLGHGLGLELHEAPTLDEGGETLVPGDVVTIEPGLYRRGFGGCRIEDIVLVTEDGYELLTTFPYDLAP